MGEQPCCLPPARSPELLSLSLCPAGSSQQRSERSGNKELLAKSSGSAAARRLGMLPGGSGERGGSGCPCTALEERLAVSLACPQPRGRALALHPCKYSDFSIASLVSLGRRSGEQGFSFRVGFVGFSRPSVLAQASPFSPTWGPRFSQFTRYELLQVPQIQVPP